MSSAEAAPPGPRASTGPTDGWSRTSTEMSTPGPTIGWTRAGTSPSPIVSAIRSQARRSASGPSRSMANPAAAVLAIRSRAAAFSTTG